MQRPSPPVEKMRGRKYAQDGETRSGAALLPQQTSGSGLASWERLGVEDSNATDVASAPTTRTLYDTLTVSGLFNLVLILKLNLFHNNHPDSAHFPGTGRRYNECRIKGCSVDESILPSSSALPPPHPRVAFV